MANFRCKTLFSIIMGLLACFSASQEVYDDPRTVVDIMYQDDNDIGSSPSYSDMKYDEAVKDLLLYKLLKSMQNNDEHPGLSDRSGWRASDDKLMNRSIDSVVNIPILKPVEKRLLSNLAFSGNKKISFQPGGLVKLQQKWKSKKGKSVGSHIVCYFKLCSFRPF